MMKKVLIFVSVVSCMSLLFAGYGNAAQSHQDTQEAQEEEYIGSLSAMDNEISLLLKQAEIDHVDTFGSIDYYVGTLCGPNVVICRSGIGKIYASA